MKRKFKSQMFKKLNNFKKKKLAFLPSCLLALIVLFTFHISHFTCLADTTVLQAGVSISKVPKEFYGTWRVKAKLISANNPDRFKENNIDLWNLSRSGNVITLDNPFSGAHASIMFDEINGNYLKFRKSGDYNSQKLTDTVELKLSKDTFTGTNYIKLDTISQEDGTVVRCDRATYKLTGEKISGDSVK